ncbi:MAG: ribbon-helix-helix protein, CopG family [Nanoarchaeota archaeon]
MQSDSYFSDEKIKHILHKYKEMFAVLEQYDKTREWPIGRARLDITLSRKTILKLKKLKEKTGKPISHIIEEALNILNK